MDENAKRILQVLNHDRKTVQRFCDFMVKTDTMEWTVHKAVLAGIGLKSSLLNDNSITVNLPDAGVANCIDWIYTGHITQQSLIDTLYAAKELHLAPMVTILLKSYPKHIVENNDSINSTSLITKLQGQIALLRSNTFTVQMISSQHKPNTLEIQEYTDDGVHSDSPMLKTYKCPHCVKEFSQKSNMHTHIKSKHLDERPFACSYCQKSFKLKAQLKVHLRIHTGEKPYECKFCDRQFSQQNTLKQHERIHTGERPYFCKTCNRSYTQKSALIYHLKKLGHAPRLNNNLALV